MITLPEHRSPSQWNQYNRCPYSYYLSRVLGVWQRPAAWLPQGTAVHTAVEAVELSGRTMAIDEALAVYYAAYDDQTTRYAEQVPIDYWFASGPYLADDDIPRRRKLGAEMIGRYYAFIAKNPEQEIWTDPDGVKAVEYPVEYYLDKVLIRGMIDQVIEHPELGPVIRDVKSGNTPGDVVQLVTYAVFMRRNKGLDVKYGDYWMGRSGKPTVPYDLTELSEQWLTDEFGKLDEAIRSELFEPDPEPSKCRFCFVRASCPFFV